MSSESDASLDPSALICPLCGAPAEIGTLYASDKSSLHWFVGEPNWKKSLKASFRGGIPVGGWHWVSGAHATGIRCTMCKRIVLDP
jgi:hypothetical protein